MIDSDSDHSRGILLIGHGSRDQLGTRQFFQLADRLGESVRPLAVEPALLEFQEPTIEQAWNRLADNGVQHIHVAPLLLFAAAHAKRDIPTQIKRCASETPAVTWDQSLPLSRHPSIVDHIVQQVQETRSKQLVASPTALVMVGRGSRDPCAQADMRVLGAVVNHRLSQSITTTYTAFYAMAQPSLDDVLEQVAASGRFDSVVVQPHLLFAGRLHQAIIEKTKQAAEKFVSIRFALSPCLGPSKQVAQAIADRVLASRDLLPSHVDR